MEHQHEAVSAPRESEYERSVRLMAGELATEEVVRDARRRAREILAELKRGR